MSRAPAPLPIDGIVPRIVESLRAVPNAVVTAPPGAGKSTRLPPAIAEALCAPDGKSTLVLQPRRAAARSIARRIADERGEEPGGWVGWQVRFEDRTTRATRLAIITEGILTRRLLDDPFLEGVGCVVLDEFHERSIHADLGIALLREVQQSVRPDLRIVAMSATLEAAPVAAFLGGAPIFDAPGRLFPVEVEHFPRPPQEPLDEAAARAVLRALDAEREGHVLVFLPGLAEIDRTRRRLGDPRGVEVHRLHSSVPAMEQDRAISPSPVRKVVLSTNIAETSLTIDGVRVVIDSGYARSPVADAALGLERLVLRRISRSSAEQRAGRAGRTGPGRCWRLWAEKDNALLPDADEPEVRQADLAPALLALHAWGAADPGAFAWFEKPPLASLRRAEDLLRVLGAIDAAGRLSPKGRRMAAMPAHPRIAAVLAAGIELGCAADAALVAAVLSEMESLRGDRRAQAPATDSDLLDLVEEFEDGRLRAGRGTEQRIRQAADRLRRIARAGDGAAASRSQRRRLVLQGWPDRVAARRAEDDRRALLVGGRGVVLEPASGVLRGPLLLCLDIRDESGDARVGIASSIEPEWLAEDFPQLRAERLVHRFDAARGRVVSEREATHLDLVVKRVGASPSDDPEAAAAVLRAHLEANPAAWLDGKGTEQFLARAEFLRRAMPDLDLPGTEQLRARALEQLCAGAFSLDQIRKRGVDGALAAALSWEQRRAMDEHAPERIEAPSGARHAIDYGADPPALAVRLQEVFGWAATPRIAAGRVAIVLHLLAPNQRPVQVTRDLESFWAGAYQEVRRELRARYPKHPWPEDPWTAKAIAVGGRRRR